MTLKRPQNKQTGSIHIIVIIIAIAITTVLAVAGVRTYVATGGFEQTVTANTAEGIKQLLANAKAGKYDAKCSGADESGPLTLYMSGSSKIRVDMTISGKPGHLVRNGSNAYLWADGDSKGSKLPYSDDKASKDKYSADSFANDVNKYKLVCQSAHVDTSKFQVPGSVTFTDWNSQAKSYESN